MITFLGKMYNYTSNTFIDSAPRVYSIAQYLGSDISIDDDGTTRTDIPLTQFEIDSGTNIGIHFEFFAREYFDINGVWPILRLLTTNDPEDYYLEWTHDNPTGFNIKAPDIYMRWSNSFQWDDSATPTPPHYNSYRAYVFVSVATIEQLAQNVIIFSGCVHNNQILDVVETMISYTTFQVSAPSNCLISNAGTYLGRISNRTFYKTYDGPMIAAFHINPQGNWYGPVSFCPAYQSRDMPPYNGAFTQNASVRAINQYRLNDGITVSFTVRNNYHLQNPSPYDTAGLPVFTNEWSTGQLLNDLFDSLGVIITYTKTGLYDYLQGSFNPVPTEPDSDVDPENIPPVDEPPTPIPPDDTDPYYDPVADPDNPLYDPTQNPTDPDYDPTIPHDPWKPPTSASPVVPAPEQPPQDNIDIPAIPPAFVTNNAMFTLYNPSGGDLNNLAAFLWSPAWSVDTFKKIFANPLECILGLMVMPLLPATVNTKEMSVGNIATGVTMHYFTNQFHDFDCGTFTIKEFYMSYLDYAPYTKVSIYLPYIGAQSLDTDEVMGKTVGVKYRFDLATGDCVAFVTVDGSVFYTYSGNCASRLPLSGNNWNGIVPAVTTAMVGGVAAGVPALGAAAALAVSSMKQNIAHSGSMAGSPGLMGIQKPYLIITRPRQAMPLAQNSFTGYPSFITESLGGLSGYTEIESCHLEHIPCTAQELEEIENLLKEGVLF